MCSFPSIAHFGNTSFSSSVSVYSIGKFYPICYEVKCIILITISIYHTVPQFTLVSTPVYGRLGEVVNMSCIANETLAPIIWGLW